MWGRNVDDQMRDDRLRDDLLRAELNRLVPAMPPEGQWPKVIERASSGAEAASYAMAGAATQAGAGAGRAATKARFTERRLTGPGTRGARRRSALTYAAISFAVLVLLAGAGAGIFEAVTHLGKGNPVVIIGDDTLGATATGQTTQMSLAAVGEGSWQPFPVTMGGVPVRCLVIDPSDSSVLYAATDQGLFKSTDAAANWVQLFGEVTDLMAVDPASPSTVYAHTEDWEQRAPSDEDTVLLRSDDGGTSWHVLDDTPGTATLGPPGITNFLFDMSTSPSTVYYYGWGLGKSTDRGETWTTLIPTDSLVDTVALDLAHPGTLYAVSHAPGTATQPELVRSTDGGATWESLDYQGYAPTPSDYPTLRVDPTDGSTLYMWREGSDEVFESTDQGQNWTVLSGAAAERARVIVRAKPGTSAPSIDALSASAGDSGGTEDPRIAAETGNPPALYMPTESGVSKSIDAGATWKQANHGLGNAGAQTVQSVVVDPIDPSTIYVCTEAGICKSTDGGKTWDTIGGDFEELFAASPLILAPSDPSVLYVLHSSYGSSPGGLFRSGDGGLTWDQRASAGLASTGEYHLTFVAADAPDTLFVYDAFGVAENSLLRSTDGGDTWEPCQTGGATVLHSMVYAPSEPSTYYASCTSSPYQPSESPGVLVSRDAGASWTYRATPGNVLGMAVDAKTPEVLYILCGELGGYAADYAVEGTLYQSVDAGRTWQKVDVDLPGDIQWVVSDPDVPGRLYALTISSSGTIPATGGRFYRSDDQGATWEDMSAGLEYDPVTGSATYRAAWGFANDLVADRISGTAFYALTRSWTGSGPGSGLPVNHLYKWVPEK